MTNPLPTQGRVAAPDAASLGNTGAADLIGTPAFIPGRQRAQLIVADRQGRQHRVVHDSATLIEAPNWSPDGRWLVFNSAGALYKVAADGADAPVRIDSGMHAPANNDHVLAPDGRTIYFSTDDGQLLAVPFDGGTPRRVSNRHPPESDFRYYLHGISPDGATLAYVGLRKAATATDTANSGTGPAWDYGLYTVSAAGGPDRTLLEPGVPVDGPEYSPDGAWLYFNGEIGARTPGHAQLFRMRPDGSGVEQLTHDERVNWFPHPSPDGRWLLYLSYPPGTFGHPANRAVILRLAPAGGGTGADMVSLLGGQGTLNVNSWAPDSERFAYVAYPAI
jgi:TolB protein